MGSQRAVLSLGLIASSKRKILDGTAFAPLFPKTVSTDPYITQDGTVHDTVDYCIKIVANTLNDTKGITKYLAAKSKTKEQFCKNLFDYAYNHYQYQIDKSGVEQLRRPARAFRDRKEGIDCDCFAITCGSILHNANIDFYFRIVKMFGRDYYQHIYVVVPKFKGANMSNKNNYYTIDPVLDKYNVEAPGITQKNDKIMNGVNGMPIQYLNGTDTVRFGEEFNGIGEDLGDFTMEGEIEGSKRFNDDFLRRKKVHLINTRKLMDTDPRRFQTIYNLPKLKESYDKLIPAWDQEHTRCAMLDHLSGIDEEMLRPELQGLGSIIHGTDEEFWQLMGVEYDEEESFLGKIRLFKRKTSAPGAKKTGVFTKIKNATKTVAKDISKLKTKDGRKAAIKKLGKNFMKYNPAIIPIRLGFLAGLKTNFGKISERLYWGYFPLAEAQRAGVTASYWNKSVAVLKKAQGVFEKLGGSPDAMKKAVVSGRAAKKITKANAGKPSTAIKVVSSNRFATATPNRAAIRVGVPVRAAAFRSIRGIEELLGVQGQGMGSLGEPTSAVIAAGLSALTAVAALVGKMFKKSNGKEETETGGETEAIPVPTASGEGANSSNSAESDDDGEYVDTNGDGIPDKKKPNYTTPLLIGGAAVTAAAIYLATRPKSAKGGAIAGVHEKCKTHKAVKLS